MLRDTTALHSRRMGFMLVGVKRAYELELLLDGSTCT